MSGEQVHPLRKWRLEQVPKLTLDAAAAGVETFRGTWFAWESGRRIPDREFMQKLFRFTGGVITADNFHFPNGYPDLTPPTLPLEIGPGPLFTVFEADEGVEPAEPQLQDMAA